MTKLAYVLFLSALCFSCTEKGKKQSSENPVLPIHSSLTEDTACLFSQLAYCTHAGDTLTKYLPGWTISWQAEELNGNHAFVAGNGRESVLAIRGSLMNFTWAAFQNWVYQDLHVMSQRKWNWLADSSAAMVSEGAYSGWENLSTMKDRATGQLLLTHLDSLFRQGHNLLITGHSLGGNLASIYGSYLWRAAREKGLSNPSINIITFGAPAAGDALFAADFNKKFPASVRVENELDIVPKFPTIDGIGNLKGLFSDSLSAGNIQVGYKNVQVPLSRVFSLIGSSLELLDLLNTVSPYEQTNAGGKQIRLPLSGKNKGTDVVNWLNEAGYHHSIESYAVYEKIPVIHCE